MGVALHSTRVKSNGRDIERTNGWCIRRVFFTLIFYHKFLFLHIRIYCYNNNLTCKYNEVFYFISLDRSIGNYFVQDWIWELILMACLLWCFIIFRYLWRKEDNSCMITFFCSILFQLFFNFNCSLLCINIIKYIKS